MLIERIKSIFRRLQWKLTLSYAAVTVGSLLIVVLNSRDTCCFQGYSSRLIYMTKKFPPRTGFGLPAKTVYTFGTQYYHKKPLIQI